ncbi:MAG: AmmeMemoRadiSam system protein B [Deltaproteobacteria bacterium]|nr:AmmeMemoRadiSam system protein B [Deltaproteobacteria bacterium]
MDNPPRLRPVEAFPVQQEGKTLICLRDPQHFANTLVISPVVYFILSHFDGRHSLIDIQEAYSRQFSDILFSEDLNKIVEMLDQHYFLYSGRFLDHQRKIIEDFRRLPTRPSAHAGTVYKEDPQGLRNQLEGYFRSPHGPGQPGPCQTKPAPRAIVAPHIDFHRGGPSYAWSYKELAESPGADLYILLGTSHCGGENPFTATLKDFATPLGTVETDKEFVREVGKNYRGDLFAEEHLHRTEHSLEFQVVYLKYIATLQAELTGRARPFRIVPILVSSFHPMVQGHTLPEKDPRIGDFLKALRELVEKESRQICFVAGVDLAHVGIQFGDQEPLTPDFLRWVGEEDQRLIEKLASLDAPGFFEEIAKDRDRRRICGFSPLYSLIHLLDGVRGRNLKYSQAFTRETGSAVTFTSMVFD